MKNRRPQTKTSFMLKAPKKKDTNTSRWWNLKTFVIFTPKLGEDFLFWRAYFQRGLFQPPTRTRFQASRGHPFGAKDRKHLENLDQNKSSRGGRGSNFWSGDKCDRFDSVGILQSLESSYTGSAAVGAKVETFQSDSGKPQQSFASSSTFVSRIVIISCTSWACINSSIDPSARHWGRRFSSDFRSTSVW